MTYSTSRRASVFRWVRSSSASSGTGLRGERRDFTSWRRKARKRTGRLTAMRRVRQRNCGGMTIHGECRVIGAQFGGPSCARSPMPDPVAGRIPQPGLESLRVFPQLMQQPIQFGFGGQAQRFRKLLGASSHLTQVDRQRLPTRRVGVAGAVGEIGGVGEESHGRCGCGYFHREDSPTALLAWVRQYLSQRRIPFAGKGNRAGPAGTRVPGCRRRPGRC